MPGTYIQQPDVEYFKAQMGRKKTNMLFLLTLYLMNQLSQQGGVKALVGPT